MSKTPGTQPQKQATSQSFSDAECFEAAYMLRTFHPELSAYGVLSPSQRIFFAVILLASSAFCFRHPMSTFLLINLTFAGYFVFAVIYRFSLMLVAYHDNASDTEFFVPSDYSSLPIITILAPLYRDADSVEGLSHSIDNLDYPTEKKDVKLLIEENDPETAERIAALGLIDRYELIIVPNAGPQTKPKACNFGLLRARGDLVVIYDAEDQPEADQLIKAARAFQNGDQNLACTQARLNYYNSDENWLTRLFTLEYSLWFDWLLPALQKINAPIPLGGTSNFFRTRILRSVGGWDPFNVTEDADLGLRLARLGYRVEMLNSTTYEEANCEFRNWIRQRSRWIKGHLQTWLVHMRAPGSFVKNTSWRGLLSIQLLIAGNVFCALINPILWVTFVVFHTFNIPIITNTALANLNFATLIIGNVFFIACMVIAPLKRDCKSLWAYGLSAPIYWLFASIAAYIAILQIITKPYYWEKTKHMISRQPPPDLRNNTSVHLVA